MSLLKKIVFFLFINFGSLGLGSWLMNNGPRSDWYNNLNQAPWTPAGWVFGVAWSFIMICFSVYMAYLLVPIVYWIVFKTSFGLRLRAVGENPSAVDTAGINVFSMRYKALAINGVLIAFAGAHLSTAVNANFFREMSAGRGYLALAALIFGKWHPKTALLACLLFGFTDALQIRLQGVELPIVGTIPVQLIQGIPYVLTVILLAGFVGKAVAPRAIGQPYIKES